VDFTANLSELFRILYFFNFPDVTNLSIWTGLEVDPCRRLIE